MVDLPIKCILFVIILSLPLAVAGQPDENTNASGFNISVVVNDIRGNPINGALIKAISSSGSSVLKQTDSKGRADLEITKNSDLNVTAVGYRDWVSKEPISPGILMLTLESEPEPANTNFHIIDTERNNVPDALIIVEDSVGNQIMKISDAEGKASGQVSLGRANITIKADGYNDLNDNSVIISGNATYTYVLNRSMVWKIAWDLFVLMLPVLLTIYINLVEWPEKTKYNEWYAYMPTLGWVISFVLLISATLITKDYNIYFLDPMLKVSLFVPIAAFIGATSYITLSVLKNIERNPPESEWKLIYIAYGRRLFIAPYIAIIAVFTILEVAQLENPWAILFFAYFVGLYTKQIEGTLEEIGKKFLTEKQKIELAERDIKSLEIVRRLGVSTSIATRFDDLGISEISDLIAIPDAKIKEIADKAGIDETYLTNLRGKAKKQVDDIEAMGKDLGICHDRLSKFVKVGVCSKDELAAIPDAKIKEIADEAGIDETYLANLRDKAKKM